MGREIRRVPPNWEHPVKRCEHSPWAGGCGYALRNGGMCFQPLLDTSYKEACTEWKEEFSKWEAGQYPDYADDDDKKLEYWEWGGNPPNREYYCPEWPEGIATWYQVYETVSEGTPVTPPFASKDELAEWLSTHKDFTNNGPLTRAQADAFVRVGWVPSVISGPGIGVVTGMEIASVFEAEKANKEK